MDKTLRDLLGAVDIFSRLDTPLLDQVIQAAVQRSWEKDSFLSHYGDIWPYLFLVRSGQIDSIKESPDGRQLIIMNLTQGDVFWGLSFFNKGTGNPVAFYARRQSELYLWSQEDLLPILMQNPSSLWNLCQLMINRMLTASEMVEGLAFQAVPSRLARFLVTRFSSSGERSIHRNLTLDEIAASIGTTREHACRALYQLADQHLIEITRTEFTLTDEQGLNQIADS